MDDNDLSAAWRSAQDRLPPGWAVDSLRCASTGLAADERSDDWIAVAVSQNGDERTHRAVDPLAALAGLADSFRS